VAFGIVLLYGGLLIKNAWVRSHAAPEVLWTSGGQLRVDQLRGVPYLGRILASVKDTYGGSRGWVSGNLAITPRGIDFLPGFFARGDGVQATHIPWGAVNEDQDSARAPELRNRSGALSGERLLCRLRSARWTQTRTSASEHASTNGVNRTPADLLPHMSLTNTGVPAVLTAETVRAGPIRASRPPEIMRQ
jgi:hypothetical protein